MSSENTEKVFDNIPEGWGCANLADCTTDGNISYGIVQPGQHTNGGIPIIRINNINNGHLLLDDVLKVSPEIEEKYKRTRLVGGEVLLTLVGSTGKSFVAPVELAGWNVPRAIAVIRPKEEIGADWINICLQSKPVQHFLDVRANTTVQKTLNLKDVRDIPIPLPPQKIKQKIESITIALQDKIKLNHQINQALEQMAQAIFKSWFVDFEPVKAKIEAKVGGQDPERAAMCAISGKTDTELDQLPPDQLDRLRTTAALFPDELVESDLGLIPRGWEASTIGKEFHATMGQSPPGHTYNEIGEGISFFQGRRDFGWRYPVNRVFCTEPKRHAKIGDTLLSVRAPVGDVNKATSDCCIGRGIAALRHKSGCEAYTYYTVKRLEQYFSNFDTEGTVFGSINQKDLKAIKIIRPKGKILIIFSKIAGDLDSQILNHEKQITTLAELRDTLLPKLLSGDLGMLAEKENDLYPFQQGISA